MAVTYEDECAAAGLDPKAVARLAARLERVARDARALNLEIFGGSTAGSLRALSTDSRGSGNLVVASITAGAWNGGDGAYGPDEDGLMRGE